MDRRRRLPARSAIAAALLVLPAAAALAAGPHAQRLTRLADSPTPGAVSVGPSPASIAGVLYFPAWDPRNDSAIWAANGSSPRATLLRSVRAQMPVPLGGRAFFVGSDPTASRLWTSDGSPDGTRPVAELGSPGAGSLTVIGDDLYLIGGDGHPWISDGSAAGSQRLSDDAAVEGAPTFVPFHGAVWFLALGADAHLGLWSTSGTSGSTQRVADLGSAPEASRFAYGLTGYGGRLFFYTSEEPWGARYRMWSSDGSSQGTAALRDFPGTFGTVCPGQCFGIGPETLAGLGANLVFFADDGTHGRELWRTDGTPGGTQLLADVSPGGGAGVVSSFLDSRSAGAAGSYALFVADDGIHGEELWTTDGTSAGTRLLVDIVPGPLGSYPYGFVTVGDEVFFAASDAIWRTDGTAGGTAIFREGAATLYPIEGGFAAVDGGGIWTSDGAELKLVDDLARPHGLDPTGLTLFGGGVVFSRLDDDNTLHDLWRYARGEAAVVRHFASLSTLPVQVGGALYFGADDGVHGVEPWVSDGTEAGTRLLHEIAVPTPAYLGAFDSNPSGFTAAGPSVYFIAGDGTYGVELWATDGTDAGTRLVEDFEPGEYGSVPGDLTPFEGALTFTIAFPQPGGLWRTDGTGSGTRETAAVSASNVVAAGTALFFIGYEPATGFELWTSDGTTAGTRLVRDVVPGQGNENFYGLTPSGARVFFIGQGNDGQELWTSDGTATGTRRLATFRALEELTPLGGGFFFAADDGEHGLELWASDGTPEGTRLVRDVSPGLASSSPASLAAVGDRILFAADDGEHGIEPWVSDGTEDGTRLLEDVSPGTTSSRPGQFLAAGSVVYFRATDEEAGAQLWSIPAAALEPRPGERPRTPRVAPPRE